MNKAVEENNLKIVITIFSRFMCTTKIILKKTKLYGSFLWTGLTSVVPLLGSGYLLQLVESNA